MGAIGALVYVRGRQQRSQPATAPRPDRALPRTVLLAIGLAVAVVCGLFGLGGQLLSVPLLVSAGVAMLPALSAAQAQSIVIAGVGTVGYALRRAPPWPRS